MEPVRHRVGEPVVVDVEVELVDLDARIETLAQAVEQRLVGARVPERLPLDVRTARRALRFPKPFKSPLLLKGWTTTRRSRSAISHG